MQKDGMSPIGKALFDMLGDMGRAQTRIYSEKGCTPESMAEAASAVEMHRIAHQPNIDFAIQGSKK